jgi:hypothetical protein
MDNVQNCDSYINIPRHKPIDLMDFGRQAGVWLALADSRSCGSENVEYSGYFTR